MSGLVSEGVWGALVGATLGAPHKGKSAYTRLAFFDPIPLRMSPHESLDAWWVGLSHLRAKRSRGALGHSFLTHWTSTSGESAFGLSNMALGFGPTLAGKLRNPLCEGSNAFGRAAFWGLAFHGQPDLAAEWAYYDAAMDHAGDGRDLPAALAWITAASQPGVSPHDLVGAIPSLLPVQSPFLKVFPQVLEAGRNSEGPRELTLSLPGLLETGDSEHAAYTFAFVIASLLSSPARFGPALLKAVGCGRAADQAGMAAGAVSALLAGKVGREWLDPLGKEYVASHALRGLEVGADLAQFTNWVEEIHQLNAPLVVQPLSPPVPAAPAAPQAPELGEEETAAAPEVTLEGSASSTEEPLDEETSSDSDAPAAPPEGGETESSHSAAEASPAAAPVEAPQGPFVPQPSTHIASLIRSGASFTVSEQSGVELTWQMLDDPIVAPSQSVKATMTFHNVSPADKEITPELQSPEGWKSASRLTGFRLPSGATQVFPFVLQSPATPGAERVYVKLRWGSAEYRTPLLPAQLWHVVGPFVNHDGAGFTKEYPAESKVKIGESFMGRSDLPVKWEARWMPGIVFDLEKEFKGGPGAVILWAKLRFAQAGRHKIFVSSGIGVVVKVNGAKVLSSHDHHRPDLRRTEKYTAFFDSKGEDVVMIKVLRDRSVLEPLVIAFFGPDGQVVHPTHFLPMD